MDPEVEKNHRTPSLRSVGHDDLEYHGATDTKEVKKSRYQRWAAKLNVETRGIERIPLEERQEASASSVLNMLLMWFSMGLAVNSIIVGSMGTLTLQLSFTDAALCAIFALLLGCSAVGYMSTWGPRSGNRTLIMARYFMGYYPSKICCLLNVLTNLGYGMINSVIGGQILSKVSGGNLSVVVGIVIVALISWLMATFGMRVFELYERVSWLPQLMTFCVLVGSAGSHFDFDTVSVGSPQRINAKRLSFFSLCLSVPISWIPLAADYYVYYQPTIKRTTTWSMTVIGAFLGMIVTVLLGVGLGTGVAKTPEWGVIYDGTPGSLLMAGYGSVGALGKLCAVINVLGVVACNAPGSYSMAMNFQMLGDYWLKIPRPVFTILTTVVYTACAIGGRSSLYTIFQNFLPLIGYWIIIWFTIVIEEDQIFNRKKEYDWSIWNSWRDLPLGIAAGLSFLIGWVGAIVGMDQVYYTGPIAGAITGGADLGIWLGVGFTALSFPPLRMLEIWLIGR